MFGTKGFVKKSCSHPTKDLCKTYYLIHELLSDQLHSIHILYSWFLSWNDVALKDAFTFYVYSKVSRYLTSTGRPIHYR